MTTLGESVRVPAQQCPYCGHQLDSAAGFGESAGARPKPGDVTLCIECAEPLLVQRDMTVRKPSVLERESIVTDPATIRLQEVMRAAHYARVCTLEDMQELARAILALRTNETEVGRMLTLPELIALMPHWPTAKVHGVSQRMADAGFAKRVTAQ